MKASIRLGQIGGIHVFVHWSFAVLLLWIVMSHVAHGRDILDIFYAVGLILAVFGCVVLHEYGHARTARRFGIKTRDIILLPIGGIARLERMPKDPLQELQVALAGPAVNAGIAALLWGILKLIGTPVDETAISPDDAFGQFGFLIQLMYINTALVIFNLFPAFPMDGGRVLRAFLAVRSDYVLATRLATNVGQLLAILLGIVGLFTNWFLVLVAMFVFFAGMQEEASVEIQALMNGVPVRNAMITEFHTLSPLDTLSSVEQQLLAGEEQDFPVVSDNRVVGILTRGTLLQAMSDGTSNTLVGDVMQAECHQVKDSELLQNVWQQMLENQWQTVPVVREQEVVGLVTQENVNEWIMLGKAKEAGERPIKYRGWR